MIDEAALAKSITSGHIAGAGLDVFETEPPRDSVLTALPQVVATPHIAASTVEAQEQVGLETAAAVRDFLVDGVIRNAVNFPAVPSEDFEKVRPFMEVHERPEQAKSDAQNALRLDLLEGLLHRLVRIHAIAREPSSALETGAIGSRP